MARLNVVTPEQATGQTGELYGAIKSAVGAIPNIYQGVANSPAALGAVLQIGQALKQGRLGGAEAEAIRLAVSEANGCDYCLAAHTLLGRQAGLSDADVVQIRRGRARDSKIAALVGFVNAVLRPNGALSDADIQAVKAAGYDDAQITEALLVIGETTFTNMFNRVHQTPLDFPAAPKI
jgi:uncharacterized peroxidase-related enzyme